MKAGSKDWGKGWSQQEKGHRNYLFESIRNKKKGFQQYLVRYISFGKKRLGIDTLGVGGVTCSFGFW